MALTRDEILAFQGKDIEIEKVNMPEWGDVVFVRSLDGKGRDGWEASNAQQNKKGEPSVRYLNARARLVARAVCDETGNTLAFGSTTGSLWVTDDQGDSWQTISTHLPPVYAVHFEK